MDTLRLRSPRPPQRPSSRTTPPLPPPRPPLSAATSPSHDDYFSFPSPFGGGGDLLPLSMSRTPVVGRVGSDLSHLNHARTTSHHHHAATTSISRDRDREHRAKSKATSPFFSGRLGNVWRKENATSSSRASDAAAGKPQAQAEDKRKDKARRSLDDVGQWVKRHMASMVEQLRASFSRQGERERRREQRQRRPHSFSGHGPSAAGEGWRRRRGPQQMASAPASLRVSPANSGHLSVGGSVKVSTSSEESTMEELHSAIEAAIAHCKNSIAVAKNNAAAGEDNDTSFSKP
ncbi:hypothetical protein HU200_001136 [Digitaria exilis]|uniref:BRI1 kinase inhibitor 1 n=1 Tax=Digitaria exilis TaxID=1010633 RepID=A0A835FYE8_9POAL|nr:hypothetical protein HU200_001136 [Digitaria exilis]